MTPHHRKHRLAEINVVPYIDVMLVLLIIFMITSPLLTQGVDVQLPTVQQAKTLTPQKSHLLVITLNANGQLFLDDHSQPLDHTALLAQVSQRSKTDPQLEVLLRGHTQLPYGTVVGLMGQLREIGIEKVGLLTQPPNSEE